MGVPSGAQVEVAFFVPAGLDDPPEVLLAGDEFVEGPGGPVEDALAADEIDLEVVDVLPRLAARRAEGLERERPAQRQPDAPVEARGLRGGRQRRQRRNRRQQHENAASHAGAHGRASPARSNVSRYSR